MKYLTVLTLTTAMTFGMTAPAAANTTDIISEAVNSQLNSLSANIRQQAKLALEKTAADLFYATGDTQAEQPIAVANDDNSTEQTATDK